MPYKKNNAHPWRNAAWGLLFWVLGWGVMLALRTRLDPGNLGLLLILTSAIAAVWLPLPATLAASLLALLVFNWTFVPPLHTFTIDIHQHAILVSALLVVNGIVAGLMISLREQSRRALWQASMVEDLRSWGEKLRDAESPHLLLGEFHANLEELTGHSVHLIALRNELPAQNQIDRVEQFGASDSESLEGLWHCLRNGHALGPGTGRYEELAEIYLPMRGRGMSYGAMAASAVYGEPGWREQARALCDQMGAALERHRILAEERRAREESQAEALRNTLLAAISHDYRTPLATIMGAASAIEQQSSRLTDQQLKTLARSIVDEADRLRRLTNNILQLARLDRFATSQNPKLKCDWESAEEMVGSVVRRMRQFAGGHEIVIDIQPNLPLLWCDSLLLTQLLENLFDNALKHGPPNAAIQIRAFAETSGLIMTVWNQGPGIEPQLQEQIFTRFYRDNGRGAEGAGVGLALCLAIARAHGGELFLESTGDGTLFKCRLPLKPQPAMPAREPEDTL
jgi:two-component system sensor histidine kinase KdpD